ncbi:type II toxin-antitoxin system HicA family toxin [Methylocella silvestris]
MARGERQVSLAIRRRGRVTVPHPSRDVPIDTLKSIEKQSGLKLR